MPLKQEFVYKIWEGVKFIPGEENRVIGMLKDVRLNLSMLDKDFKGKSLQEILKIIEEDKLIIKHKSDNENPQAEIVYEIDLSNARTRINNYRHDSEGGCQSCKLKKVYTPLQGEHFTYCEKVEDEVFARDNWSLTNSQSPRISQFYKTGCGEKEPILKRKLEEVLKDYKE